MACRPFRPDACYPSHLTPSPRSFPHSTRFRLLLSVHQPLGWSVARSRIPRPKRINGRLQYIISALRTSTWPADDPSRLTSLPSAFRLSVDGVFPDALR